jgi:quercetin dioxygenase-like cupin family protein
MGAKFSSAAIAMLLSAAVLADDPPAQPAAKQGRVVNVLMTQKLAELPGRVTQVLTVEYAPGYESASHTHPGPVYGYILEGSFTTEVDGQPLTTYTKGQTFYEPSGGVHRVSKNASTTEPLKLLIFILAEEGKPIASPVKP